VSVSVVIPVYKEILSNSEIKSLVRCKNVLTKYDTYLVYPKDLDIHNYKKYYSNLKFKPFPKRYFEGISGYNRLMLSTTFYGKFLKYNYILIYQLDSYVFKDELNEWAKYKFDYIGAPYYANDQITRTFNSLLYSRSSVIKYLKNVLVKKNPNLSVGNGGFSLRRVYKFWIISFLFFPLIKSWLTNEDYFWSLFAPNFLPFFNVASIDKAKRFSIEKNSESIYKETASLPFGCHAWEKYEPKFWKDFIK